MGPVERRVETGGRGRPFFKIFLPLFDADRLSETNTWKTHEIPRENTRPEKKAQTKPKPTKSEKRQQRKPGDEQRNPLTEKKKVITLIAKQSYDRTLFQTFLFTKRGV